jgi:hypothetical protein
VHDDEEAERRDGGRRPGEPRNGQADEERHDPADEEHHEERDRERQFPPGKQRRQHRKARPLDAGRHGEDARQVGAEPHEGGVPERDDPGVAGEGLDREHEHDRDQEVDDHALVGRRRDRLAEPADREQRQREPERPARRAPDGPRQPHSTTSARRRRIPSGRT